VYKIAVHADIFAVCRLPADFPIPAWASDGALVSATRTPEELSIVCREDVVPLDVTSERGWRCLCVEGVLDFALVGVLLSILQPLAQAAIPVFVMSTFVTDYVLIKAADLERAVTSLEDARFSIRIETPM
jgi:hypothetical protein